MRKVSLSIASLAAVLLGCSEQGYRQDLTIHNELDVHRASETVTIPRTALANLADGKLQHLEIKENGSDVTTPFQLVDSDKDGVKDALIFQPQIGSRTNKQYQLSINKEPGKSETPDAISYSRFVPERVDDYAWENDRVAFRTFGPEAKRRVQQGKSGGIVSSGIDCWLKRVEYPIIDKWYRKVSDGTGDYHVDTGEGLDNYHVGASLGCGGTGALVAEELFTSGNFVAYETLENGPLRTSFELYYDPWDTGEAVVSETKKISLDKGSNLTRYELVFDQDVEIVAGLSLDENSRSEWADEDSGVFSSWRQQDDSELGLAIVADPKYISGHEALLSDVKDQSHLYVRLTSIDKTIVYYAGFGWKKSGQFGSSEEWIDYLRDFARQLQSPIRIEWN